MSKSINFIFCWIEKIVYKILKVLLRMSGRKMTEESWNEIRQGIRFLVVGVWNLLCSYIVYTVCILIGLHYLLCHIISFLFSVLHSFFWTRRYVFRKKGNTLYMLGKVFLSFVGTGLILQGLLLMLWVDVFHIPEIAGPLLNICILTPMNFILQRFWAYK